MTEAIDPAGFANLVEITGGDLEFVDELVDTWLAEGESQLATLRAEAAGGDVERLTRAAHSMKSGAINVGALRLGELCRALEEDGRAGAVGDETTRVALIGEAFDDARRELLAERAARTGGGSPA